MGLYPSVTSISSTCEGPVNRIAPPLHPDRPRVAAFGGGKGGSGRSTLCADLVRALARHNQRILCIDANTSCPTLHLMLGCDEPHLDPNDTAIRPLGTKGSHIADFIHTTAFSNVWLASLAAGLRHPFAPSGLRARSLIDQFHELDFDWVFIDLPASNDPLSVGLFTLSDIPVVVCTPEPAAVRESTQFLRSALYTAIGYYAGGQAAGDDVLATLDKQPLAFNAQNLRYDAPGAASRRLIDETMQLFETYVVVNQIREGAEQDLGFVLAHAWYRELNLYPRVLGSLDYQDRRWFFNRRTAIGQPARSEEAVTNDVEALSRNIRDIDLVDSKYPRPVPPGPNVHPAIRMGITPETSRNEVRQHCRRLWEGYRRETTVSLVFTAPERRLATAEELEELYRKVLTMPSETFTRAEVEAAAREYDDERAARVASPTVIAPPGSPRPFERYIASAQAAADHAAEQAAAEQAAEHGTAPAAEPAAPPAAPTAPDDGDAPGAAPDHAPDAPAELQADDLASLPAAADRAFRSSPGKLVTNLRRQYKLSLQELSSRTHIGVKYLAAIEDVDLEVLPRDVYLRGYLREIARVFDVDAQELIDQYFQALHG